MEHVQRAAEYVGLELDSSQLVSLETYLGWLHDEAIVAGGLGPEEAPVLERRHIADSILFGLEIGQPTQVWDLGSGVGLPGIPLAICMPHTSFTLIDRSGRRVDLLRRAVRVLDLDNVEVSGADISALSGRVEAIVSRATLPPESILGRLRAHLLPGGVGILGGSWRKAPHHDGFETLEIPAKVLDQTVWLLMMRQA